MPCMCVTRVIVSLVNNLYGKHERCWFILAKISVFYESEAWTNFWSHLTSDFEKTFFYKVVRFCVYINPVKF